MCGISGIFRFHGKAEEHRVHRMTHALGHRGPDGENFWKSPDEQIVFGHRRLSITDLSSTGSQPMSYMNRYTIVFNGAIYNHVELRSELKSLDYQFHTASDTEIILASYSQWKEKFLSKLDGMFAFAIWDEQEQKLFCARDRFGQKPFYYIQHQGKEFLFASEPKAFFAAGIQKIVNRKRLFYLLAYDVVEDPANSRETFFENIFQLEAGHYLIVSKNRNVQYHCYWKIDQQTEESITSIESADEKFRELLSESVQHCVRADVEVGSLLSGGIDSSSIAALAAQKNNRLKTFSIRFPQFEKDEVIWIDEMKNAFCFQNFQCEWNEEEALDELSKIIFFHDEPISGASILGQWQLMKFIKSQNLKVILDGQGADELLAGYHHFLRPFLRECFLHSRKLFTHEMDWYQRLKSPDDPEIYPLQEIIFRPFREISGTIRRKISTPKYFRHLHPDFVHEYKTLKPPFKSFNKLNDALRFYSSNYGLGKLLRFADRNSMAHGIEVRMPFLNHHLTKFIFLLPSTMKIHDGFTKFVLRKAMQNILPPKIQWRTDKIGLEAPERKFIQQLSVKGFWNDAESFLTNEKILSRKSKHSAPKLNLLSTAIWLRQ